MIAVSYIMKRKIKKIFFKVISNSKIFNIIFFNEIVNDQDFPKLTGGLDKGGGTGQRRIRYYFLASDVERSSISISIICDSLITYLCVSY